MGAGTYVLTRVLGIRERSKEGECPGQEQAHMYSLSSWASMLLAERQGSRRESSRYGTMVALTALVAVDGGNCLDVVAESGEVIFGVGDGECGVDSSGVSDKGSVDMWRERRSDGNREAAGKEKWQAVR